MPAEKNHILVVDDEECIRKLINKILTAAGFSVLEAENGKHAVEVYRCNMDKIVLVTLDIRMPGISGIDTYRQLASLNPKIRVILCSGYLKDYMPEGANAISIQKPFSVDGFQQKIKEVLSIPEDEIARRNAPFLYIRI